MLIVFRRVLKKKGVCVGGVIKEERNHLPGVCDRWGSTRWVCRAGGLKESLGTAEGGMGCSLWASVVYSGRFFQGRHLCWEWHRTCLGEGLQGHFL